MLTAANRLPVHSVRKLQTCQRLCISAFTDKKMPEKKPFERLPLDVVPVNYVLQLEPDLQAFTFVGHEDIAVEVRHSCCSDHPNFS